MNDGRRWMRVPAVTIPTGPTRNNLGLHWIRRLIRIRIWTVYERFVYGWGSSMNNFGLSIMDEMFHYVCRLCIVTEVNNDLNCQGQGQYWF